jgi:uncharacterized protein (UPF0128 family)
MIYKFETEKENGTVFMELKRIENEISISLNSEKSDVVLEIHLSKEKLYDLIGVLHSIQSKMKGGSNGKR